MTKKLRKPNCTLRYTITVTCSCESQLLLARLQLSIEEIVNQFPDYLKGLAVKKEEIEVTLDKQKSKDIP